MIIYKQKLTHYHGYDSESLVTLLNIWPTVAMTLPLVGNSPDDLVKSSTLPVEMMLGIATSIYNLVSLCLSGCHYKDPSHLKCYNKYILFDIFIRFV